MGAKIDLSQRDWEREREANASFGIANCRPDGRAFVEGWNSTGSRPVGRPNGMIFGLRKQHHRRREEKGREEGRTRWKRRSERKEEKEEEEEEEEGSGGVEAWPQKDSFIHLYVLTVLRDKPRTRSFSNQSLNCRFVWTDGHVRRQTCSTYDWQKPPGPWKSCDRLYIVDRSRETSVSIPLASFLIASARFHPIRFDSRLDLHATIRFLRTSVVRQWIEQFLFFSIFFFFSFRIKVIV